MNRALKANRNRATDISGNKKESCLFIRYTQASYLYNKSAN
jgi:hypothetical protein